MNYLYPTDRAEILEGIERSLGLPDCDLEPVPDQPIRRQPETFRPPRFTTRNRSESYSWVREVFHRMSEQYPGVTADRTLDIIPAHELQDAMEHVQDLSREELQQLGHTALQPAA